MLRIDRDAMLRMDRRAFITGIAAFSTCVLHDRSFAQTSAGPFSLPPLP